MPPVWASAVLTPKYATLPLMLFHEMDMFAAPAAAPAEQSIFAGLIVYEVICTFVFGVVGVGAGAVDVLADGEGVGVALGLVDRAVGVGDNVGAADGVPRCPSRSASSTIITISSTAPAMIRITRS